MLLIQTFHIDQFLECFVYDENFTHHAGLGNGVGDITMGLHEDGYVMNLNLAGFQVSIYLEFPPEGSDDAAIYSFEVGNKNHRPVIARNDGIYGNDFYMRKIPQKLINKIQDESETITAGYMPLKIRRTHVKALNTDEKRCDESISMSNPNTGKCVTKYLEDTIGCSMGLSGSNPNIPR